MKQIKIEQINAVLQVIYGTNISGQNFDSLKKLFSELPEVQSEPKGETPA